MSSATFSEPIRRRPALGLPERARGLLYLTIVAAVAAATATSAASDAHVRWSIFAAILVGGALAQVFATQMPGYQAFHTGLAFTVAAALLLPPELVVVVAMAQHLPEWLRQRYAWFIQLFNISNLALSGLAAWSVRATVARDGVQVGASALTWSVMVACAAALTFVLVNHALLARMLWLARGLDLSATGLFTWDGLILDLVVAAVGVGVAFALLRSWALAAVAALPLVLIQRARARPTLREQALTDKTTVVNSHELDLDQPARDEHALAQTVGRSPSLEHIIERPRLLSLLGEDGGARITLLAAPAGYGKTTLARQWSERQTGPVAWYPTTRASGDVGLLAVQLDELLSSVAPVAPTDPLEVSAIASVNPSPMPLGRAMARRFERLTQDVLLVVDEWEAAGTAEAEELLAMLVQGLDIRFVITTRIRPAWFRPRLEMYGEGREIGMGELAMTDQEATKVLARSEAVVGRARMLRAADGWPAVLGLAAMSGEVDLTSSRLLSNTLYEYLATELLAVAPPETQDALMLLATASIADVEVARTVLGASADSAIEDAHARGLVAVTDTRSLSLHPLLRELLTRQFEEADAETREALLAQCRHLFDLRRWDEALSVAEVSCDAPFVTDAIEAALDDLLARGRAGSLQRWIAAARAAGAEGGIVDYAESAALLRANELDRALALALQAANSTGDLASRAHIVAARAAQLTDRDELAEKQAELAVALAQTQATREKAVALLFTAAVELESPHLRDRFEQYERIARPGIEQSMTLAAAGFALAELEGGLAQAIDEAGRALSLAEEGIDPLTHTELLNMYIDGLVLTCRYEESLAHIDALMGIAESYGLEFPVGYAQLARARALVGMRSFGAAGRTLSKLEGRKQDLPAAFFLSHLPVERARLHLSLGEPQRALDVLARVPLEQLNRAHRGALLALRAFVHAASGHSEQALALAGEARITSRRQETMAVSSLAEAVVALDAGQTATAAFRIQAVIDSGVWDPVVIAVRSTPTLGAFIAEQGDEWPSWLQRLLSASSDSSLASQWGLRVSMTCKPGADLTPRESEVHELLAQGLTNQQIAQQLYLSVSTVKVHVKHIYEKLGVQSRAEAARALSEDL